VLKDWIVILFAPCFFLLLFDLFYIIAFYSIWTTIESPLIKTQIIGYVIWK
jgi:hypothetical protein